MPFRYFIHLSFDGSNYKGWQTQPNGVTVQSVIENAIQTLSGCHSGVVGCGRTDTGVHARDYYAHFEMDEPLADSDSFCRKLDRFLPPVIHIITVFPVKAGTHARFSALSREYHYSLLREKDPFIYQRAFLFHGALDFDQMNQGAAMLLNSSDFECFSKVNTQVANFKCRVDKAIWLQQGPEWVFEIRADRFLRNMVRSIVGTLIDLGKNRISLDQFNDILLSKDRKRAGMSVPARGLTLWQVSYPPGIRSEVPEWSSNQFPDEIKRHDKAYTQLHDGSGDEPDE